MNGQDWETERLRGGQGCQGDTVNSAFAVFAEAMLSGCQIQSCLGLGVLDLADFGVGGLERGVGFG